MTNTLLMDRRRLLQGAGYVSLAFSIPALDALAQAPAGDKPRLPGDLNSVRKIGAWIQINADKTADRLTVVQRIFRCLIRQSEALLRNIHAQYPFQSNRWATRASAVWVVRGDDLRQR